MELTQRQLDVLNHVVTDAQAWGDNVKTTQEMMINKVAKYEADYDKAIAKGDYQTRKQRDTAGEQARQDAYDNVPYSIKRQRSYPPIGDQLDALWKGGDDAEAMKVIVDKVKSDNPKG